MECANKKYNCLEILLTKRHIYFFIQSFYLSRTFLLKSSICHLCGLFIYKNDEKNK